MIEMKYPLLIKKLHLNPAKYIAAEEIKAYCKILNGSYDDAIRYLTRHRYLYTIFKGIFYKPSIEERKLEKLTANHLEAIAEALKYKKVDHWYFGLETALKMNALTHEFYAEDTIINDTLFRKNPLTILGNKIKIIKIKPKLTTYGIKKIGIFKYSDTEKTVLDIVYLSKYKGLNDEEIKNRIAPLIKSCSKKRLTEYAKGYNLPTKKFIEEL